VGEQRAYDVTVKLARSAKRNPSAAPVEAPLVRILVADSGLIQSVLLSRALRARRNFQISTVALERSAIQQFMQSQGADVVMLAGTETSNFGLLRWLHASHPSAAPILLVDRYDRELVVNAFRAGVRGLFLFQQAPFRMLCKCVNAVAGGQIWINSQQMHYVVEALSEVDTLRVVNSHGKSLITPREEQVVALVSDGLSNRDVAKELGLSEHTIKKYMLRIFDKLGISTRVELVLYAVSHGEKRQSEWISGSA
jgi:DNA-binding NarL/FixJ family response regulator